MSYSGGRIAATQPEFALQEPLANPGKSVSSIAQVLKNETSQLQEDVIQDDSPFIEAVKQLLAGITIVPDARENELYMPYEQLPSCPVCLEMPMSKHHVKKDSNEYRQMLPLAHKIADDTFNKDFVILYVPDTLENAQKTSDIKVSMSNVRHIN